jgi:hypothetical protein
VSSIDSFSTLWDHDYAMLEYYENYDNSRVYMYMFSCPFEPYLLCLQILATEMFYKFSMTSRVITCIEILGFEDFGSKTPIMQVLDCHYSPQRATSSRGELNLQGGVFSRLQLVAASSYSPWRASSLARRVDSALALFACFA